MQVVYKYEVQDFFSYPKVEVPLDFVLLHVARLDLELFVWGLTDPEKNTGHATINLAVRGTGQQAPNGDHLATIEDGQYIWHVFQTGPIRLQFKQGLKFE